MIANIYQKFLSNIVISAIFTYIVFNLQILYENGKIPFKVNTLSKITEKIRNQNAM